MTNRSRCCWSRPQTPSCSPTAATPRPRAGGRRRLPWRVVSVRGRPVGSGAADGDRGRRYALAVESSAPYRVVERAREPVLGRDRARPTAGSRALRAVKDAEEIARIAAAQAITDDGLRPHPRASSSAGMTETQIALELEFFMRARRSRASRSRRSWRAARTRRSPHAHPGLQAASSRGDFVKMDFGARVGGYCADMTRTVVVGRGERASARDLRGGAGCEPRRASRPFGRALPGKRGRRGGACGHRGAGFAENFRHGLGHGVGLEVHELPGVGSAARRALAGRQRHHHRAGRLRPRVRRC